MQLKLSALTHHKKRLIPLIVFVVVIIVVALMLLIKPAPESADTGPKAWPVKVQTAEVTSLSPQLILYGKVESSRLIELRAPTLGYIAATPVLEGHLAQAGETVIQLDSRDIDLVVRQRQAQVNELKAQVEKERNQGVADAEALKDEQRLYVLAEREMARIKPLLKRNLASLAEYERAESNLKRSALAVTSRKLADDNHQHRLAELKARLANAQAQLDSAKLDLSRTAIKAPYKGMLAELSVSVGDRVKADQSLAKLYDYSAMEVRCQIPTQYVPRLRQALGKGEVVTAMTRIADHQIALLLTRLSGQVVSTRAGVDGLFTVTTPSEHLPLGATVKIELNLPKQANLIAVPVQAIYDNKRIYAVVDQRLKAIDITVVGQRLLNGTLMTLIHAPAIKSGQQLAITHLPNAITGLPVRVVVD